MSLDVRLPARRDSLSQVQALLSNARVTLTDLIAAQRQLTDCLETVRLDILAELVDLETGIVAEKRRAARALKHP